MVNQKKVPEWLNSSLWSNPNPNNNPPNPPNPISSESLSESESPPRRRRFSDDLETSSPPPPVPVPVPRQHQHNQHQPPLSHRKSDPISTSNNGAATASTSSSSTAPNANAPSLSPEDISRHAQLLVEVSKKVINTKEVRRLASMSVPDSPPGVRSLVWKLLLGYLPSERATWQSELSKKRSQYNHFKDDLLTTPSEITRRSDNHTHTHSNSSNNPPPPPQFVDPLDSRCVLERSQVTPDEHPLSLGKSSVWNQFFQDTEIIEQIDRDVKRTHPDMQFFSGDTAFAKSNQDALRNILIVFAKLNPGIRYVQGMNEILAPLFFVFRNDPDEDNAAAAEADTFFCFVELLSGFRDNFCQQLDNSVVGIRSTITKLSLLLKEHDEELWRHLEVTCKINPQFYAFRWITLLLTQEFNFNDSLHIWDTLLSDPEGPQETLLRICCAMLILIRRRLLAGDFTSNLKLLQNYPSTNISHLLYVANKLRAHPTS